MKQMNDINEVADFLNNNDCYAILTHQFPDGDTLGSAYALCEMLQQKGKKAKVLINGDMPAKFAYLEAGIDKTDFEHKTVISVDVADSKLLGELEVYTPQIVLAIDHHETHKQFAENSYVKCLASNCENIFELGNLLNITFTKTIANAIYTGMATDTGCFKFTNTTAETHIVAAKLMQYGCDAHKINKAMFDTVSKNKKALEAYVIGNMQYYHNDEVAFAYTTKEILKRFGVTEDQVEGISAIPRTIEGVKVGITLREKDETSFKISIRSNDNICANQICARFGGGGHKAAAGCVIEGTVEQVRDTLLPVVYEFLEK
ncbi:MAG: DHH family phosphoesterase [Acutalibacteraceae bacterium]|nr:DHH family phosphoesterase [Acutalibacteraceae bacterium]